MSSVIAAEPVKMDIMASFDSDEDSLMQQVESNLLESARQAREPLDQMILHILEAGGKRLRPRLAIACASFGKPRRAELITTAAALEMIHMASLIHDDVIDESHIRRGRRTINHLWGNLTAVLAGDYLFSTAFHHLCSGRLYGILELLTKAIGLMCEGEINQASTAYSPDYTLEAYYDCIYRKTACLFAASCQVGALAAGCSPPHQESLHRFGLDLGYAYQILDDILDLVADAVKLGKPTGSDLSRGLLTLPTLFLLRDKADGPWLKERLISREEVSDYLPELKVRLAASGSLDQSINHFQQHIRSAENALMQLPAGGCHDSLRCTIERLSFELSRHLL